MCGQVDSRTDDKQSGSRQYNQKVHSPNTLYLLVLTLDDANRGNPGTTALLQMMLRKGLFTACTCADISMVANISSFTSC